ncbi:MAG TPA: energy transducer TonB [Chitinophagaceae bacterium]|nr:energy transducer TonB [Chitinophagaceae bacterium]HPH33125.1 energy transducer TonB [Chitinophagaceae bacterium]HPN58496.1 energy transducer TonB [Chitinophagaceae bacterium]
MEANKILSADVLDIIFDGKNKDYGAYELRKTYNRRITRALIITGSVALLALLSSILSSTMKEKADKKLKMNEMTIQDVKQEEKKAIPPPPPPPPPKQEPPKVEMKQFTPPVIKKDDEVEKPPPPQEELKEAKIDVVSQEGIKDEGIAAPVDIDQGKQIVEVKKEDDENKIFDKVEIEASFPGGDSKWRQYLERNANGQVATDNGAPEGTYTTVVQFVVDKEGNISDVRALTNHGYGMEEEAIRVIKKGPKWSPAVQNGRQVKAYRKQPITFRVEAE